MRKVSSIVGLPVIASADGVNLGTISEVVVDLSKGRIVGVVVGEPPGEQAVEAEDIAVIGPDAIMIGDRSRLQAIGDLPALTQKRRIAKDKPSSVITKSGTRLGTLADIYVDSMTHQVTRYDVSGGPVRDLTDGTLALPVVPGMVHGPDTVIVPDTLITTLEAQTGGLRGTWGSISRALRKDLQRASDRATVLYQRSSEGVKEVVDHTREKSEQVSKTVAEKLEQSRASTKSETATEQEAATAPASAESADEQPSEESECKPRTCSEEPAQEQHECKPSACGQADTVQEQECQSPPCGRTEQEPAERCDEDKNECDQRPG